MKNGIRYFYSTPYTGSKRVAGESYRVLTIITPELIPIVCPSKIADRTASTVPAVLPCNMMLLNRKLDFLTTVTI